MEKILSNYISDNRFVSGICKKLIQFNHKNINNPTENEERICMDISPSGQQAQEKNVQRQ